MKSLDLAKSYIARGWSVLPIAPATASASSTLSKVQSNSSARYTTDFTMYCDDSGQDLSKINTRGAVVLYQKENFSVILQALRDNPTNFITKYLD